MATRTIALAALTLSAQTAAASTLEGVLERINQMGGSPLLSIMVNLAETIATPAAQDRKLLEGDRVILGYDVSGNPVTTIAGPMGVTVTPVLAASMTSGLAAGLYPVGSALYALPPAGQLSLFDETVTGRALETARELAMSRIDGSVTNIIEGLLLPDLVPATLVAAQIAQSVAENQIVMQDIRTTVLGAVNTGEIVTNVTVSFQPGGSVDLALAGISNGADIAVQQAQTRSAWASSVQISQIGGQPDVQALALNIAHSASAITGAVVNRVNGQSVVVGDIVTTVLGAVNGGRVNGTD
jgi:hypothetical protein